MGFLDGLKKNLGFDKAEHKPTGRPSEAPQKAAEASTEETVQSPVPEPSAEAPAGEGIAVPDGGAPAASAGQVTEVVVEADDTLSGIAMQFGVDLDALIAANADTVPNPDHIYPGQVLRLP
ncbi:LysM peptidoglycan-binding domain-containing protein [Arthrobacter sp. MI7-26]|uniref:LysM peptidoglycan-binding domain-containing protein n=1 Tax=Arthrobacter sp. MI7-26 TaxID=2993653 RepID=UPI002248EDCC|nr:LysM peptidoglycan-binding domain-containing protein [Arthrobacter sp. MI7-26]MCX2750216.1 LysM peptidoglycan-binding domain-containing protein [Arthrobacter sp. MI7-26]